MADIPGLARSADMRIVVPKWLSRHLVLIHHDSVDLQEREAARA
jgi:hypothetical protein